MGPLSPLSALFEAAGSRSCCWSTRTPLRELNPPASSSYPQPFGFVVGGCLVSVDTHGQPNVWLRIVPQRAEQDERRLCTKAVATDIRRCVWDLTLGPSTCGQFEATTWFGPLDLAGHPAPEACLPKTTLVEARPHTLSVRLRPYVFFGCNRRRLWRVRFQRHPLTVPGYPEGQQSKATVEQKNHGVFIPQASWKVNERG